VDYRGKTEAYVVGIIEELRVKGVLDPGMATAAKKAVAARAKKA
jgi:hypothetical protein